ncbi:MAG: hypothetical protein NT141_03955 [candidate division WWE3 bacterium]|nr:hypothetical protein [candidate division WWE3 bacterium]
MITVEQIKSARSERAAKAAELRAMYESRIPKLQAADWPEKGWEWKQANTWVWLRKEWAHGDKSATLRAYLAPTEDKDPQPHFSPREAGFVAKCFTVEPRWPDSPFGGEECRQKWIGELVERDLPARPPEIFENDPFDAGEEVWIEVWDSTKAGPFAAFNAVWGPEAKQAIHDAQDSLFARERGNVNVSEHIYAHGVCQHRPAFGPNFNGLEENCPKAAPIVEEEVVEENDEE